MREAVKTLFEKASSSLNVSYLYLCASPKTRRHAMKQFMHLCKKRKIIAWQMTPSQILMTKQRVYVEFKCAEEAGVDFTRDALNGKMAKQETMYFSNDGEKITKKELLKRTIWQQ
tara:strand:+ start:1183 stop:1527 length:345 start_codon:yes stop_codon:yes gene_type:complete